MAELGNTPGGRRGYAGTWPPRAAAPVGGFVPSRPALWQQFLDTFRERALCAAPACHMAAVHRDLAAVGSRRGGRRAVVVLGASRLWNRHRILFRRRS